jgi:hypothetical protein
MERMTCAAARAILQFLQFSRKVFGGHSRQTRCRTLIKNAHFAHIGADALEDVISSLLSACPAGILLVIETIAGNPCSIGVVLHGGEPDTIYSFHKKRFSMKKVLVAGLLAVCLVAISQQQASAWCNQRFSIGFNLQRQSGNNDFFWGFFHNGQVPGPEIFHGGASHPPLVVVAPVIYVPYVHDSFDMPSHEAAYTQPSANYASPYQFATYPRPAYSYPATSYYYYGR